MTTLRLLETNPERDSFNIRMRCGVYRSEFLGMYEQVNKLLTWKQYKKLHDILAGTRYRYDQWLIEAKRVTTNKKILAFIDDTLIWYAKMNAARRIAKRIVKQS